jgi:hypothetical protein
MGNFNDVYEYLFGESHQKVLQRYADTGDLECLKKYIEEYNLTSDNFNFFDIVESTIWFGINNANVVKFLANLEFPKKYNKSDCMFLAIEHERVDVVDVLFQDNEFEIQLDYCLQSAFRYESITVAEYFMSKGADIHKCYGIDMLYMDNPESANFIKKQLKNERKKTGYFY